MSDVKDVEMSLEDLFLSHEFGKVGVASAAPTLTASGLFPEFEAPRLMVPRAGSVAVGHSSTTHMRRNRTYAVVSGTVAAALVVAISLNAFAQTGKNRAGGGVQALQPNGWSGFAGGTAGHFTGGGSTTGPATGDVGAGSNPATLADEVSGNGTSGFSKGTGTVIIDVVRPIIPPPVSPGGGSSSSTAPAGTLLAPVIQLVGHVVNTTGNTVTIVTDGLGTGLPVLSPVTGLLGNVSDTLSEVGGGLVHVA